MDASVLSSVAASGINADDQAVPSLAHATAVFVRLLLVLLALAKMHPQGLLVLEAQESPRLAARSMPMAAGPCGGLTRAPLHRVLWQW